MQIITLDGARMTDRDEAHRYLAETLRLPAYYGHNLDALYDCLQTLGPDTILILRHPDAICDALGEYGDGLLRVFSDAAANSSLRFFIDPAL
ncbi:MAG: barstar family protein [Clostridia bacterium]|nr:barstar family protein [Clostridia bacterium]